MQHSRISWSRARIINTIHLNKFKDANGSKSVFIEADLDEHERYFDVRTSFDECRYFPSFLTIYISRHITEETNPKFPTVVLPNKLMKDIVALLILLNLRFRWFSCFFLLDKKFEGISFEKVRYKIPIPKLNWRLNNPPTTWDCSHFLARKSKKWEALFFQRNSLPLTVSKKKSENLSLPSSLITISTFHFKDYHRERAN